MAFPKKLKQLCTPAFLYFSLSMLGVLVSVVQNLGNSRRYNLGMLSTSVPSTFLVFVVKIIYILFWTWVLNLMCKDGHKEIAWFLVLIPFILLFLIMGSMMGGSSYEGFYTTTETAAVSPTQMAATAAVSPTQIGISPTQIVGLSSTQMAATAATAAPVVPASTASTIICSTGKVFNPTTGVCQ